MFKVRGGLVYFDRLKGRRPQVRGIVTATRGNEAIRAIYSATHNCAEGAGAAALAGLLKERERLHGPVAVILSGQNIDRTWMQTILAGGTPRVS